MNSSSRLLHTYGTVMHGFAVRLTEEESRRMSSTPGVSACTGAGCATPRRRDRLGSWASTREFGAWPDSELGDGVIIGFIDSGIWPESASFNDTGLGPVRSTWKGTCVAAEGFNASSCNNKLVGAKVFAAEQDGTLTPRDKVATARTCLDSRRVGGTWRQPIRVLARHRSRRGAQSTDRHVQGVQHGGMFRVQHCGCD
ncbi:hypothetical protein ACQ4PT_058167 [Festuca glaucescens]